MATIIDAIKNNTTAIDVNKTNIEKMKSINLVSAFDDSTGTFLLPVEVVLKYGLYKASLESTAAFQLVFNTGNSFYYLSGSSGSSPTIREITTKRLIFVPDWLL